ncbi:MAG: alcohol dehydrogenase catalytic domain-containing protein, partial [Acidimicrobiia bacterium]
MQAWRVHELGEPETVLQLDDVAEATPGPDEVLVEVAAASLNFPDVLMCRGEYQVKPPLPFTPGAEVSGTVAGLGDGVDDSLLGQRVIAIPTFGHGGFTARTIAPKSMVFPIP